AFGPFETDNGRKSVSIVNQYCDLIYAREKQSYQYLVEAGANPDKVLKSCDFTFKVNGTVPDRYYHLKGTVCIIPNQKMVTHSEDGKDNYLQLIKNTVNKFRSLDKDVFLLN